jgi:exodeoxyribonuclease VII small subunit
MSDESYTFSTARARLEDIVAQVRKKDTSLEKSLDLLEEGVRLANVCTELIDHADWTAGSDGLEDPETAEPAADEGAVAQGTVAETEDERGDAEDLSPVALEDESDPAVEVIDESEDGA